MDPVKKEDIPKGYKAHNTNLFTVEKFLADGRHDKYKSQLVAHGNERMQQFMQTSHLQQWQSNC